MGDVAFALFFSVFVLAVFTDFWQLLGAALLAWASKRSGQKGNE